MPQKMKDRQKITRLQLDIKGDDESILIGIVSSDPDYRISLGINKILSISMRNQQPLEIQDPDGNNLVFSRFSDLTGAPDIVFSLVSNRSGNKFLLKRLRNIDYLFHVHDSEKSLDRSALITQLREIEGVTAVFDIDLQSVKDKNADYLLY